MLQKYLLKVTCSPNTMYIQKRFHFIFTLNPTISHKVNPLKTGNNFDLMSSFLKPQISLGGGLPDAELPAVSVHKKPQAYIFAIFYDILCSRIRIDALENPRHLIMRACVFPRISSRGKGPADHLGLLRFVPKTQFHLVLK